MNTSPLKICSECNRKLSCLYPCDDAYNEANDIRPTNESKQSGVSLDVNKNKKCRSDNEIIDEFMQDLLEYDVSEDGYLQICNGLRKPSDAINWKYLLEFMSDRNEVYCDEMGICPVCRSELVETFRWEEYWGSKIQMSEGFSCRNGC